MQFTDEFLNDLGLGGLPDNARRLLLRKARVQLEVTVGSILSKGLSDEKLRQFEAFENHDEASTIAWLDANVRRWPEAFDKSGLDLYDFASHSWLVYERPKFRDVVEDTFANIRLELLENRDSILAHFSSHAAWADEGKHRQGLASHETDT